MNVLITGAAGYLGNVVVNYFINKKINVIALDKMYFGCSHLQLIKNKYLKIVKGDLTNKNVLKKYISKCNIIIHLAGIVGEEACNKNKVLSNNTNFLVTKNLIKYCNKYKNKKIIYISTCSNYGIMKNKKMLYEDSPLKPLGIYAEQKVNSEKFIINNCKNNFNILRLGTLFGLGGRMRFDLLINNLAMKSALNIPEKIYTPLSWRPYLEINEAAKCIYKVAIDRRKLSKNQIYNILNFNIQKVKIVNLIKKINPKSKFIFTKNIQDHRDYAVSTKKFNKHFNVIAKINFRKKFKEIFIAVKDKYYLNPLSSEHTSILTKE